MNTSALARLLLCPVLLLAVAGDCRAQNAAPLLEEIRARCFSDDFAKNPLGKYFNSLEAYDFPTSKPVGQLILLAPGLKGGRQPTAATRRGDGVAAVPVESGAAGGKVEAMTLMTRNVLTIRGRLDGLEDIGLQLASGNPCPGVPNAPPNTFLNRV